MNYKKVVATEKRCRCGEILCEAGSALQNLAAARIHDMPPGVAWEVMLPDRTMVAVARCEACDLRTSLIDAVFVTKMIPAPHDCPCGCGYTVFAMREIQVANYYLKPGSGER